MKALSGLGFVLAMCSAQGSIFSIRGLELHTNVQYRPTAIIADGSVIAGGSIGSGEGVCYWDQFGRHSLGVLDDGRLPDEDPTGMSDDGKVIVGGKHSNGFVWTPGSGLHYLFTAEGRHCELYAVSGNGLRVSGEAEFSGNRLGAWYSADSGWNVVKNTSGWPVGYVTALSSDGHVMVGLYADTDNSAFRFDENQGFQYLKGFEYSTSWPPHAWAISRDGQVVVGDCVASIGIPATLWTATGGRLALDNRSFGASSVAKAVSSDGSVIVGVCDFKGNEWAFVWTSTKGMRLLNDILAENGIDTKFWRTARATGVTADGQTIVGIGLNELTSDQGFVATIAGVPRPAQKWTVQRGKQTGGQNVDVRFHDDSPLVFENGIVLSRSESPITATFETTSFEQSGSQLTFTIWGRSDSPGLRERVELYNWQLAKWDDSVAVEQAAPLENSLQTINVKDPDAFIEPGTKRMMARIKVRPVAPVFSGTWHFFLDQMAWEVMPKN